MEAGKMREGKVENSKESLNISTCIIEDMPKKKPSGDGKLITILLCLVAGSVIGSFVDPIKGSLAGGIVGGIVGFFVSKL